jgi:molybdenum cofactor cytidylyltransferase
MTTHAIVLAAGAATRFGGGKLLAELRGRPLIAWSVDAALAASVDDVTVVLGDQSERLRDTLPTSARSVVCVDWQEGLAASLRCGIRSLPAGAQAVAIFLGDMPHVSSALADRLITLVLEGAPAALPSHAGRPAHPVVVSAALFPALLELRGDTGARKLLERTAGAVVIDVDEPGCIVDIDTADDLRSAGQ